MKILVTGTKGFLGSYIANYLKSKKYDVTGIDVGYFGKCKLKNFDKICTKFKYKNINKDFRILKISDLKKYDCIIHLAALSNDPIGNYNKSWTKNINSNGSYNLAKKAKQAGVRLFLFSSSCIMYGVNDTKNYINEETKPNPKTEYAKSKVKAENLISSLASKNFSPVFIRNGTIYGLSEYMRFDTVLNNFLIEAYINKKISIFSSGNQWRPVTHIHDVARYFELFLNAKRMDIHNKKFNVGNNNSKIRSLAKEIKKLNKNVEVEILNKKGSDNRTYKVSFKLFKDTFPKFKFKYNISTGSKTMLRQFRLIQIHKNSNFDKFIRVKWLMKLIAKKNYLDKNLYVIK